MSAGSAVTFSVQVGGTPPLTFQWFHDSAPIPGATLNSYSIPNVQAADAGTYTVQVLNVVGSTTSAGAALVVVP